MLVGSRGIWHSTSKIMGTFDVLWFVISRIPERSGQSQLPNDCDQINLLKIVCSKIQVTLAQITTVFSARWYQMYNYKGPGDQIDNPSLFSVHLSDMRYRNRRSTRVPLSTHLVILLIGPWNNATCDMVWWVLFPVQADYRVWVLFRPCEFMDPKALCWWFDNGVGCVHVESLGLLDQWLLC